MSSPSDSQRRKLADTIDRMPDDAPLLPSIALEAGRLADTPEQLVSDYLKSMPTLPLIGSVLAERWRIERLLGEGGFGAVFEGRDQQLGRKVAIKVMRAEGRAPADALAMREAITRMEDRRRRFRDEARAVARAESANVVTVYDVGEHTRDDDGASWPFLVLELVDGTPLDRVVRDRPTPEVALHIIDQLAQGVATLHARGVVHRDLKPANAILTTDGRVKIIDFGLAIAASDWTEIKGPKAPQDWIEGTPQYMSPEIARGGDPDPHSDLWALGVIAYELMTGRSPWGEHLSIVELERRIAHEEPEPLLSRSGGDGLHLAHVTPIILKMLAKRPADRFMSAAEVVQALADLRARTSRVAAPSREAEQPFRYLLAFEEKDAAWFFGREETTAKLVLALEQRGRLVLAGPSGAGKTSLIQAGLIPELKVLRPLEVMRMQPGRDPLARLAAFVPGGATADDLRRQPGLVGERLREHSKRTKTRLLVQVDALEELITQQAPTQDVEVFALALLGLRDDAGRGVLLVMAVRDEYLGRLPRLSRALESTLRDAEFLGPPSPPAMVAALTRPVLRLGYTWQVGFPEEMVAAVSGQASPLPVLQLAASWVWEKRDDDGTGSKVLRRESLAGEGETLRIGDVLGQYADHKLRAAAWSEADRLLVKRMLPVMVSAERTPLMVPIDDILGRCQAPTRARAHELLRDLTDFRLLTSLRDEHARECLTPVHTTLIHGWRLLRDALEGSAELEAFMRRFERDARDWVASERAPAKLWPEAARQEFERWAPHLSEVELAPAQLAFRRAVFAIARRARALRWGMAAVLIALALGGTWAGFTFSAQANEARLLREEALSQKAVAEAQTKSSDEHRREADELIDFMLGDLRRRLEKIGQIKVLHVVAEKARDYLDARKDSDPGDATRRAAVLRNLSAVFLGEGDMAAAERAANDALAVSQRILAERASDAVARREVAQSLTSLGHMFVARGDPQAGLERYQSALALYEALGAAASDDPALLLELVVVNDRLGDVYRSLGQPDRAASAQQMSLSMAERILALEPDSPRARRNIVILRNKSRVTPVIGGDGVDARLSPEEFLAFDALAKAEPQSASAQHDLMVGHLGLGNEMTARGELGLALDAYRAALAIVQRLAAADPDNALMFLDVVFCQNKLGDALRRYGDAEGAVREHEAALAIVQRLATADPTNARIESDLAHTLTRLGDAKLAARDLPGAMAAKEAALALTEKLAAGHDDGAEAHLARTLGYYAEGLVANGETARARASLERARAILAPLLAKPVVPQAYSDVGRWLSALADGLE